MTRGRVVALTELLEMGFGSQILDPLAAPKLIHPHPMGLHSAGKAQVNPELLASISIPKEFRKETI